MSFSDIPWSVLHDATGVLADITVLAAAAFAVVKFRLLNVFARRWRSEMTCAHWNMKDGSLLFSVDYTLHNTGSRTLRIERVVLRLVAAKVEGARLEPDESELLADRVLIPDDPALKGAFWIESGERTIFSLYCRVGTLPETVFILCSFEMRDQRPPAPFRELYCTNPVAGTSTAARSLPSAAPSFVSKPPQRTGATLEPWAG